MAITKYGIQKGDTLSEIAKKKNTTVSELLKLNPQISDPNKISAGASLNIPSTFGTKARELGKEKLTAPSAPKKSVLTKAQEMADKALKMAPDIIPKPATPPLPPSPVFGKWGEKEEPKKLPPSPYFGKWGAPAAPTGGAAAVTEAAVPVAPDLGIGAEVAEAPLIVTSQQARREKLEAEVKETLTGGLAKPTLPSYEADFEALRSEHGITALETQLNTIDQEMTDLEASLRQGLYDIEGKLMPMELIGTRQRELKRQAQEQMDELTRRKQVLTNQYNTKIGLINSIMKLKEMDYNTANAAYNTSFNQAIQIQNLIEGRLSKEAQIDNQERDDARANLNVVLKMTADTGAAWTDLDPKMQTQIQQLEMQAGLPAGITQAYMASHPGSAVDYVTTGYDADGNQITSFFSYNNGNPTLIKAIPTGAVQGGGDTASIEWTQAQAFIAASPDATYEQLEVALRKDAKKLTDSDIDRLLRSMGKVPADEIEVPMSQSIQQLKALNFSRKEAEAYIKAQLEDEFGEGNIPKDMWNSVKDDLVEVYGRTFWQKLIPGGR